MFVPYKYFFCLLISLSRIASILETFKPCDINTCENIWAPKRNTSFLFSISLLIFLTSFKIFLLKFKNNFLFAINFLYFLILFLFLMPLLIVL